MVIVFVDDFDLSTLAALRYAKSLRPTTVRAVHFVIDTEQAERLRAAWLPDRNVSLEFIDCPDRGWPGPRPNWSGTRRKHQARR